jgi:hypothetical protein
MSINKNAANKYNSRYADIHFEREGLFKLIQEKFNPREVLYPGCSIHITPSFFFPHVVFVDQDPDAMTFFSNHETVLSFANRYRNYRCSPYIQFIFQDYTRPLPVPKDQFDLILALFAGGISKACKSYLKIGGLIITNNHQNDASDAVQDHELTLIGLVQKRKGKYRIIEGDGVRAEDILQSSSPKCYLRNTNRGVEYVENENYYIFKRIRSRK